MKVKKFLFIVATLFCLTACVSKNNTDISNTESIVENNTQYVIDFNLNGGSSPSYKGPQTVEYFTEDIFFFDCVKTNYNFRGWSYNNTKIFDEKGNRLANPTMEKNMTFVAMYSQTAKMTIVSNIEGAGNIRGEGEYPYNSYVDVSAYARQGYVFVGWYYQDTLLSNTNEYKFMMWSEDVAIEARFRLDRYLLNIHTNNEDYGLVILKSTSNYTYLPQYQEYRDYTTTVTISAYSKTDVRFLGWYDTNNKLVETNAVYTFTMPNHDYILEAKWNYFKIDYVLNGGINNSNNPSFYSIDMQYVTLYAASKTGYRFAGWKYNGEIISLINTNLVTDVVLEAEWDDCFTLTVTSNDSSMGSVRIVSGTGRANENILVRATPYLLYCFVGWYDDSGFLSSLQDYSFIMPSHDYTLVAHFSNAPVNVPEPAVETRTLAQFIAGENTKAKAYNVTAEIKAFKNGATKDKYGNMTLTDGTNDLVVYGATMTATALAWNNADAYVFTNPQDFMSNATSNALAIGDTITMKMIRCDYGATIEGQGVITNIEQGQGGGGGEQTAITTMQAIYESGKVGDAIDVKGAYVGAYGSKTNEWYVANGDYAVYLYQVAIPSGVSIGDSVRIQGNLGVYKGLIQVVSGATVTKIDETITYNALSYTGGAFTKAQLSRPVQLTGTVKEGKAIASGSNTSVVVTVGTTDVTIYVKKNYGLDYTALNTALGTTNNTVTIKGYVAIYDGAATVNYATSTGYQVVSPVVVA